MTLHTIQFGDAGQVASRELLQRFDALAAADPALAAGALPRYLRTLEALDRQHGGTGPLPVEGCGELADAAITEMATLESSAAFVEITLGIAVWAMRHEIPLRAVEPVANALARRSNAATSKAELAAVFGLMQGLIAHVAPGLAADLERSNPERAWRVLHANFAITAIRTEDPALMDYAFDALEAALPDERGGFYAEALALALNPRIPAVVRERLEGRHAKWTLEGKT